jgi:hypothetical protein
MWRNHQDENVAVGLMMPMLIDAGKVIHSLRDTFAGLDPGRPYIRTVPRIGYCLLARREGDRT